MSKLNNAVTTGRKAAIKAAAAYATYQSTIKAANKAADRLCPLWAIDRDYSYNVYRAACAVANRGRLQLPTQPRRILEHGERGGECEFRSRDWTLIQVPGAFAQVRTEGDEIGFRALRMRDLDAVRAHVALVCAELDADEPEWEPLDVLPETNILGWNADEKCWDRRKARRSRSFGSVFLPRELQSDVEADLKRFTESRERLQRLELPWRRGYLLAGPPGTGKTSLSLAIAGSLGFNLATLSLTDIESDGMLRQAVGALRGRTVLVIEDIDAYSVSHDRDHNTSRDGALSLSGLLNSLDGFETPDGLVTIATTNHPEHLDAALVRSGRLDRTFYLDNIAAAELEHLFAWFYEEQPPTSAPEQTFGASMAPAEVTELFKQHLDDPQGGWAAVVNHIESKTERHLAVA